VVTREHALINVLAVHPAGEAVLFKLAVFNPKTIQAP